MSLTYISASSTAPAAGSGIVFAVPSNVKVGNVLVAQVAYNSTGLTITPPAGWTLIRQDVNTQTQALYYKIADANDIIAPNFTFGLSSSTTCAGGVMNFFNNNATVPINTHNGANSSTGSGTPFTAIYTITITPLANCILAMFTTSGFPSATTSAYQVTTSNPSPWTVLWDFNNGVNFLVAAAVSSVRAASTATGDANITYSTAPSTPRMAAIIAVRPAILMSCADTQSETDAVTVTRTRRFSVGDTQSEVDSASASRNKTFTNQSKTAASNVTNTTKT